MKGWLHPSGRRVLATVGGAVALLVLSNVSATIFWRLNGGVGLLDLDGGENLFQPDTAQAFPTKGTSTRVLAILAAYSPNARLMHTVALCSLDLVFPAAVALMGWVTIAWACSRPDRDTPRWCLAVAGVLSLSYLVTDWGENLTELALLWGRRGAAVDLLPTLSALKLEMFAVVVMAMAAAILARAVRRLTGPPRQPKVASAGSAEL